VEREGYWAKAEVESSSHVINASLGRKLVGFQGKSGAKYVHQFEGGGGGPMFRNFKFRLLKYGMTKLTDKRIH
jgi:hypothetical protein